MFTLMLRTLLESHSIESGLVRKTETLLLECGVIKGFIDIKMFKNGCWFSRITIINHKRCRYFWLESINRSQERPYSYVDG